LVIHELVLASIRKISGHVRENEAAFAEKVREMSTIRQGEAAKSHEKQLSKNKKRIMELGMLFRKTYEDNATGKLTDKRFEQLSSDYEREQAELETLNVQLQTELDAFHADSVKVDRFIDLVRRYTEFEELTTPMLNEYIEKIVVYEPDKSSGERVQDVDIFFNFIGKYELVEDEPTPEELAAQEKRRIKLAKQREANRRFYAKQKAKHEQQQQAKTA
jgi:hypothetical protein